MTTITKGALAMVLAGAVTFSVTNALLDEQSSKQVIKEIALTQSGDQKKADAINQAKKTVEDPTPITNVKEVETKLSHDNPAIQAAKNSNKSDIAITAIPLNKKQFSKSTTSNSASTNETTTTTPTVITKPATSTKAPTTVSARTGTNKTSASTTPAVTTKPTTSAKAPTTTPASKPTETNKTSASTTPAVTTKPTASAKTPTVTTAPTPTGTNTTSTTTTTTNRGQQVSQDAKEKAASLRDQQENNGKKM
ncbi:hypothetical protein [Metabacillus bambusae]|uniref:Uncharacterized protein n=1 Tax=Metabacillus bambusae TaxID=2795218 RepID=A0ABS3NAA3_9BACI|nr:hypothetical protein [Metabacillus bambusae]MBO1514914.1 hypothetical protein [Metabacillus bambusae]